MLFAHTHSPYAWQADVDTTVVIPVLALLYLYAVGRFGAPCWRIGCYAGAMVLLGVAFWTPLHHLGLHYLLTAHLLQNVILAEWAPLLAVLGVSAPMARAFAASRVWRVLTQPLVALLSWLYLAPLTDDLVLLESGLDSLCFAIIVATLEDELGFDPFTENEDVYFPLTFGDFVKFYQRAR